MLDFLISLPGNALRLLGELFGYIFGKGYIAIILFLIGFVVVKLWRTYIKTIQTDFLSGIEWCYLSVRVPKVNELSTLAVEQVFSQMHALSTSLSFAQRYIEGQVPLWYSLEMVSLGGKISFIIRTPKDSKDLVQSSIYAQYPDAEVTEIQDYLEKLDLESENPVLGAWGTELELENDFTLPIKTYKDFEHLSAKEKIVDPLRPLFESFTNIKSNEFFAVQILVRPVRDAFWKPKGEEKAQELITGVKKITTTYNPFKWLTATIKNVQASPTVERNFSTLSDVEKDRVNSVLRKVGKPGYSTLIRMLYLVPEGSYDKAKPPMFLGAFGTVSSANTNGFKSNVAATPKVDYKISESLERPYITHVSGKRRKSLLLNFKNRTYGSITKQYILNTEELATIYHLPIVGESNAPTSGVETVASRKSQPPSNLPIGEY